MKNPFSIIWRHKIISIIIILVLVGGYFFFFAGKKTAMATIYTYGTATKGDIIQSVTDSGQVAAVNDVSVKSQVSGTLASLNVVQGQSVKAGDVLAQLDSTDAQAAVDVARANLENAKLTAQQASQNNSQSLAQAQQSLQQANDSLTQSQNSLSTTYEQAFNSVVSTFADLPTVMTDINNLINGSSNTVVQTSGTYLNFYHDQIISYGSSTSSLLDLGSTYTTAMNSYNNVLAEYKSASRYSDPAVISKLVGDSNDAAKKISNAVKALMNLIQQYRDAATSNNATVQAFSTTQLATLNGDASTVNSHLVDLLSTQQSITTAIQSVTNAQNTVAQQTQSLNTLQNLTTAINDQSQQTTIAQKETALSDAQQNLSYYTVRAPFDGVAASVADLQKGDAVGGSTVIAEVITNSQEAVISMNEVDAAGVKVGQKATLTFDALPDLTMTGHVSEIDTIGTVSQGVVSYSVTIAFDTTNDQVKPGMSVTAAIVTNIDQNVLLVPNSAIKSNASGNFVNVPVTAVNGATSGSSQNGAAVKQQTVVVGLADNNNTEITSGLNEGDTVVTNTTTQAATTSSSSTSALSRILGGGGGGGLGGGGGFTRPTGSGGSSTTRTTGTTNSTGTARPAQ